MQPIAVTIEVVEMKNILQAVKRAVDEERHELMEMITSEFCWVVKDEESADSSWSISEYYDQWMS